VTDSKGHYITGLKPGDFRILEDGIPEKIVTFAEGSKPILQVLKDGATRPLQAAAKPGRGSGAPGPGLDRPDTFVGTNVFVLFDTSNYMYRGFVYASDAIADFVRGLDRADSIAVYTFSRNLSRAAPLTHDRSEAIFGLRKAVAGDDSALYNTLLLTLRDAGKVPGRKSSSSSSNGPDNRQHDRSRRCAGPWPRRRYPHLRHLHQRGQQGSRLRRRLQAHLSAHRRPGLLRPNPAEGR